MTSKELSRVQSCFRSIRQTTSIAHYARSAYMHDLLFYLAKMEYRILDPATIMRLLTMALTISTSLFRSYSGLGRYPPRDYLTDFNMLEIRERRLSREKNLQLRWPKDTVVHCDRYYASCNQNCKSRCRSDPIAALDHRRILRRPEHITIVNLSHY